MKPGINFPHSNDSELHANTCQVCWPTLFYSNHCRTTNAASEGMLSLQISHGFHHSSGCEHSMSVMAAWQSLHQTGGIVDHKADDLSHWLCYCHSNWKTIICQLVTEQCNWKLGFQAESCSRLSSKTNFHCVSVSSTACQQTSNSQLKICLPDLILDSIQFDSWILTWLTYSSSERFSSNWIHCCGLKHLSLTTYFSGLSLCRNTYWHLSFVCSLLSDCGSVNRLHNQKC